MNYAAVYHKPLSEYCYGLDRETVYFRLRVAKDDIKRVSLFYGDRSFLGNPVQFKEIEMEKFSYNRYFDFYEVTVHTKYFRINYYFELEDYSGETRYYYANHFHDEVSIERSKFYQFNYNYASKDRFPPEWVKDAVVYNIFPDSFVGSETDIPNGVDFKNLESAKEDTYIEWHGKKTYARNQGSLRGIINSLDYLLDLGVNCLYLNPIFVAGEYHKYDTIDYFHIDPNIGTNADFKELVEKCHEKGIKIIIDGVFNHAGWKSELFLDCVRNGKDSKYWQFFRNLEEPLEIPEGKYELPNYEAFGYEKRMPKLDTENPEVIDYFTNVGKFWLEEYGIDGWRIDVANEMADKFHRAFRERLKASKPDVYLIGEIWESAEHWLQGDSFDSTMNYYFRNTLEDFFALDKLDAEEFSYRINELLLRYKKPMTYAQLNLMNSHDVYRFMDSCQGNLKKYKLAALFMLSFVGVPSIFYGDEFAFEGQTEREYRRPFKYVDYEDSVYKFYKEIIRLRKSEEALKEGKFRFITADPKSNLLVFSREYLDEKVIVAFNNSAENVNYESQGNILLAEGYNNNELAAYGFVVSKE